jgi:hypothetical protein
MDLWPGGAEGWQRWATEQWISRLAEQEASLQLLEMQTRPSFIIPAMESYPEIRSGIILLDCSAPVRNRRLKGTRRQPELATERMENWAAFLREQASTLGIPVIQTDGLTLEEVATAVEEAALDRT